MNVSSWLRGLDLEQYAESFQANAIDAEALVLLSDGDLKELGVAALGHRRRLLAAIADEAAPGEAERRQVTILFADISGYTALSAARDPEETRDLLNRFFETVDLIVQNGYPLHSSWKG
jgi:class 3 adenylate cyclase